MKGVVDHDGVNLAKRTRNLKEQSSIRAGAISGGIDKQAILVSNGTPSRTKLHEKNPEMTLLLSCL